MISQKTSLLNAARLAMYLIRRGRSPSIAYIIAGKKYGVPHLWVMDEYHKMRDHQPTLFDDGDMNVPIKSKEESL